MSDKIRNLKAMVSRAAAGSGDAVSPEGKSRSRRKSLIEFFRGYRMPLVSRYAVYLNGSRTEVLRYHFSFSQTIVFDKLGTPERMLRRSLIRRVPEAAFAVEWSRYLSRRLDFPQMKMSELRRAIPYRLSSISPFEIDRICYCIRKTELQLAERRVEVDVDYSDDASVQSLLDREGGLQWYPSRILPESHIWDSFFRSTVLESSGAASGNSLYVRFTGDYAQIGLAARGKSIVPRIVGLPRSETFPEVVYNAIVTMLAEFQADSPGSKIERVYMAGEQSRIDAFLAQFEGSLPAPVMLVDGEDSFERVGGREFRNASGDEVPESLQAMLANSSDRIPQLEPRGHLAKRFMTRYVRSNVGYLLALVLTLVVMIAVNLQVEVHSSSARLDSMREEIAVLQPSYRRLSSLMDAIERQVQAPGPDVTVLDHLLELAKPKPDDVYFESLTYNRGDRISVRGYADKPDSPVSYVRALQTSQVFPEARLKRVSRMRNSEKVEYQIDAILGD